MQIHQMTDLRCIGVLIILTNQLPWQWSVGLSRYMYFSFLKNDYNFNFKKIPLFFHISYNTIFSVNNEPRTIKEHVNIFQSWSNIVKKSLLFYTFLNLNPL